MPIRTIIATAALLLSPFAVAAQEPAAQPAVAQGLVAVAPGQFAGIVEARVTLAVEAIDQAGRTIVLKDTKGEQSKFVVGDQVKNFAQIKEEVAFIADVQQVDRKKGTVTLRGALRTVTLKIKDPKQLKMISKGDQVEGVFSEAMAVAVVPAGAKARK